MLPVTNKYLFTTKNKFMENLLITFPDAENALEG